MVHDACKRIRGPESPPRSVLWTSLDVLERTFATVAVEGRARYREDDLVRFCVRFLDGRIVEIDGDEAGTEVSGAVVIYREVLVFGQPRRVVARRYSAGDGVISVDRYDE